ncbi:MAG: hypothetical protein JSV18_00495 [Candidatus Bathyarchaeota archaeon]|nr:MAG: hypothetical protein JSV18_00495 [Candidatus Bathyarchaeota archaeon]
MTDIAVIGHMAIDRIITSEDERTQLGGPPTYIALAAKRLGKRTETITKVGGDILDLFHPQIDELGISLRDMIDESAETTRFTLDYRGMGRRLSVDSICGDIYPDAIFGDHDAALFAPIIGEIQPSTIASMSSDKIALDPQGFLREVQADGSLRLKSWRDRSAIRRVSVFKSSVEELGYVTGEVDPRRALSRIRSLGAEIAIATMGREGSLLSEGGRRFHIPAFETNTVDPTGAGDAFLGVFFMEYLVGEDPLWCAAMGTAMASFVVKTKGAEMEASRREIVDRSESVFNRISEA